MSIINIIPKILVSFWWYPSKSLNLPEINILPIKTINIQDMALLHIHNFINWPFILPNFSNT